MEISQGVMFGYTIVLYLVKMAPFHDEIFALVEGSFHDYLFVATQDYVVFKGHSYPSTNHFWFVYNKRHQFTFVYQLTYSINDLFIDPCIDQGQCSVIGLVLKPCCDVNKLGLTPA